MDSQHVRRAKALGVARSKRTAPGRDRGLGAGLSGSIDERVVVQPVAAHPIARPRRFAGGQGWTSTATRPVKLGWARGQRGAGFRASAIRPSPLSATPDRGQRNGRPRALADRRGETRSPATHDHCVASRDPAVAHCVTDAKSTPHVPPATTPRWGIATERETRARSQLVVNIAVVPWHGRAVPGPFQRPREDGPRQCTTDREGSMFHVKRPRRPPMVAGRTRLRIRWHRQWRSTGQERRHRPRQRHPAAAVRCLSDCGWRRSITKHMGVRLTSGRPAPRHVARAGASRRNGARPCFT